MNLRDNTLIRQLVYEWRNFRDNFSYKKGKKNKVSIKGVRVGTKIQISGSNNSLIVEKGCVIKKTLIKVLGSDNVVILKKGAFVSGAELWVEDNNCLLEIGENTFVGHHSHLACTENGSELIIGKESMISSYVQMRTGDSHSIIDNKGNRINYAKSINISDHCWIGEGAKILKGVMLGKDTVVSTGAIVTKSTGPNVLIGGIPAKIIKENISWNVQRI